MKKFISISIKVLITQLILLSSINAQVIQENHFRKIVVSNSARSDSSTHFWINGGFGLNNTGISFGGSLNYRITPGFLFSVRFLRNNETGFKLISFSNKEPMESVNDISILYGICNKTKRVMLTASAGAGVVFGLLRGNLLYTNYNGWFSSTNLYEENNFFTVGLPLQAQLFWTPSDAFGIGLYGFININKDKTIVGAMLSIIVGEF